METKMVNIKINGADYSVPYGTTVLEACRQAGIEIPTLCYLKDVNEIGACRLCLVEVVGARGLVTSCVYPIEREGTEILTNTAKVQAARKMNIQLVLSAHEKKCLSCIRSKTCELQKYALDYGVEEDYFKPAKTESLPLETTGPSIVRDPNKCILCRRCVGACNRVQGIGAIGMQNRGYDTVVGCAFEQNLTDTTCINCGQCIVSCPVGALYENR